MQNTDQPNTESVTLSDGRVVKLRPPTGANYILALELAGGVATLVPTFEALLCVTSIDSEVQVPPRGRAQINALADRLGRDGVEAVSEWYQRKTFPEISMAMEKLGTDASVDEVLAEATRMRRERVKNSHETQ